MRVLYVRWTFDSETQLGSVVLFQDGEPKIGR
jgi:hypothetical protein